MGSKERAKSRNQNWCTQIYSTHSSAKLSYDSWDGKSEVIFQYNQQLKKSIELFSQENGTKLLLFCAKRFAIDASGWWNLSKINKTEKNKRPWTVVKVKRRRFILTVMYCNCYLANALVFILPPLEQRVPRNKIWNLCFLLTSYRQNDYDKKASKTFSKWCRIKH